MVSGALEPELKLYGGRVPHRDLASPHRDLASSHRDLTSLHRDLGPS